MSENRILLYSDSWSKVCIKQLQLILHEHSELDDTCEIFYANPLDEHTDFNGVHCRNLQNIFDVESLAKYDHAMLEQKDFGIFNSLYGHFLYGKLNNKDRLLRYIDYTLDKYFSALHNTKANIVIIPSPITAMRKVVKYFNTTYPNIKTIGIDYSPFKDFFSFDFDGGSLQTGYLTRKDVWNNIKDLSSYDRKRYFEWKSNYISTATTRGCNSQLEESNEIPDLPNNFIFLVGQSSKDANQIIHTRKISYDPVKFAEFVLASLQAAGDKRNIVFKKHPEDESNVCDKLDKLGVIVIRDNVNIHHFLKNCNSVITWNSNVGIEALLYYKPVMVLGDCFYRDKDLTYDLDYMHATLLLDSLNFKPSQVLIDKFLMFLTQHYFIKSANTLEIYERITQTS